MYRNNEIYQKDIDRIINNEFDYLKNKTIFITGAGGLVGSFLVDTIMQLNLIHNYNTQIIATFTNINKCYERFSSYINETLFKPIEQDITLPINCYDNVDYIVHAASNTHPLLYATKPVETIELNIQGTLNILNFAKQQKNARTIFLSTLEVYGEDSNIESFEESNVGFVDFNISRSCYPISKRLCETLCHSFIKEYEQDIVIARLGYIYGPTVRLNSSKADVQFLNKALNKENIVLRSKGTQKRSYCYVADTVSALLAILSKGETGNSYNIASKEGNVLLKDYAETLANIAGVDVVYDIPTEIEIQGGSKVQNSTLNSKKLLNLGWESRFTLKEGIEHTFKIKKMLQN